MNAKGTSFLGDEVSWAPARLHEGFSFQPGWAVVRPDWVAFLPSQGSRNLIGEMAWAVGGFARISGGTLEYDFVSPLRQGPHVFDQTVLGLASRGGRILRASDGDIVRSPQGTMFRVSEKVFILSEARFPDRLLAAWRVGKAQFNARETAKVFAVITAFPAVLGAVGGMIAYHEGESLAMIAVGVGFWWALVVVGWAGYLVAYLRAKRASR